MQGKGFRSLDHVLGLPEHRQDPRSPRKLAALLLLRNAGARCLNLSVGLAEAVEAWDTALSRPDSERTFGGDRLCRHGWDERYCYFCAECEGGK